MRKHERAQRLHLNEYHSFWIIIHTYTNICILLHSVSETSLYFLFFLITNWHALPVVEGSPGQNYWIVIGPFGGVAPSVLQGIPKVTPRRIPDDPIREAPPHQEGKVHLQARGRFKRYFTLCGEQIRIHTSLVNRTVSSSRLSTASVSMATCGRNRLVVCESKRQP